MLKTIKIKALQAFLLGALLYSCSAPDQKTFTTTSPEEKVKIEFSLNVLGAPYYRAYFNSKLVLDTSFLGFIIKEQADLKDGFEVVNTAVSSLDETWEQPWGEQHFIRNNYKELKVSLQEAEGLKRNLDIVFRVFDDGIGFRYEFPAQENLKDFEILSELTEFHMIDDHQAWWIPAFEFNRYEYLYRNTPLTEMGKVHTPVTFRTSDDVYMSIHEAALIDYTSMTIDAANGKRLRSELVPYGEGEDTKAFVSAQGKTPWRTVQIAEKPGDLIESYLILNLNEPNQLGDVSWFKPGRYIGIWWELHLDKGTWGSGERHSANTANTKKYIDFASENGFDGVLVEGWNEGWDGEWIKHGEAFSFTKPYPDYDLKKLSRYAAEKGVYLIGHHETAGNVVNYESQLEDAFQLLEDNGMKAVKTGYVEHGNILSNGKNHHGQYYITHFRNVIETAAKHKVSVVAHEPIKDTGERRTFPNMISREGARGQEFNAWSDDGGNPPNHTTILPFTRLLSGPMDFTPGVFDIKLPSKPNNQVNTTLAKQLALYVIIYSPVQMACDLPENYEKYPDAFEFIKEVGVDWETTKVLDAAIGERITIARKERGTEKWFVGAITNENPIDVSISLDFLDPNRTYTAKIYKDGPSTNYMDAPEDYLIEEIKVTSVDKIEGKLGSSGGMAISLNISE